MKTFIFLLFLFIFLNNNNLCAQNPIVESDSLGEVLIITEEMPSFVGGDNALYDFLKNIIYPLKAKENNVEGRVVVRFIIEKDGAVSNIGIIRKLGFGCDEEVIRLIKTMPKWNPAKQSGKPVRVYFTMPILFKL